jgi:hypothetical protein
MSNNRTYICTDCRTARRAPVSNGLRTSLRCRSCGGALWELSRKWRIPKANDLKAWEDLAALVARDRPVRETRIRQWCERLLSEMDRKIGIYSLRKPSARRDETLRVLARRRTHLLRLYFSDEASHCSVGPASLRTR